MQIAPTGLHGDVEQTINHIQSGYKQCDTLRSIRDGTFFGKFEEFGGGSNLTLFQISCFILGF